MKKNLINVAAYVIPG